MNDIGKELYERVRAGFEKRLENAGKPKDMRGVSDYSRLLGRCLAEAIAENVTENALPDGRLYYNIAESILAPALRTNYDLVNDTAAEVQRLIDERHGLRIKPARADYPAERVHAVIGAASEEGIPFDKALRRMTSPAENITASFADDFMKANAEQRSKAGFDTFIERQGGLNCCPWCAGLVGVFAYPKGLPKEVFARHDNCTCTVTYGTKGGARQHVWSKQTWSSEQEREYLRLTDEAKRGNGGKRLTPKQIAAIREKVQAPHKLTKEQAAALGAFAQPRRLTGGANGGILSYNDIVTSDKPVAHDAEKHVPLLDIFGADLTTDPKEKLRLNQLNSLHQKRSQVLLKYAREDGAAPGTEYAMIYNTKMNKFSDWKEPRKGTVTSVKIEGSKTQPNEFFHAFHNHGSSETLGFSDLIGFSQDHFMKSLTAQGNNGMNKFTVLKTDSYDEDQYQLFIAEKSEEAFYKIGYRAVTLRDFLIESIKKEVEKLAGTLSDAEKELFQKALLKKTLECLTGGEKYGVKYISSKT